MNTAKDIHYEPSHDTKILMQGTRKGARTRAGFRHPGIVQSKCACRDVALASIGLGLEVGSLAVLYSQLEFHPGIVAGIVAFDISGALMRHCGIGDLHERNARIAVAESAEEQAAIRSQTPWHQAWVRSLGGAFIVLPCLFKISSLVLTGAVGILGGIGPALIVTYVAVAIIHWMVTGYALAYARKEWAERRERRAMLCSSESERERKQHPFHVKAHRIYQFESPVELVNVENVNGHSLRLIEETDNLFTYQLVTWGRLEDSDVDGIVVRQRRPEQVATIYRHGLIHQIEIEDSEVLAEEAGAMEESLNESPNLQEGEPQSIVTGSRQGAMIKANQLALWVFMIVIMLGQAACQRRSVKPQDFDLTAVLTKPMAVDPDEAIPEEIALLAAPKDPYDDRFVPKTSILRLDVIDSDPYLLGQPSWLKSKVNEVWRFQSARLKLDEVSRQVRRSKAGRLALPSEIGEEEMRTVMRKWVLEARERGVLVKALARADGHPLDLGSGCVVPSYENQRLLFASLESELKNQPIHAPAPQFAILIEPPLEAYREDAGERVLDGNSDKEQSGVAEALMDPSRAGEVEEAFQGLDGSLVVPPLNRKPSTIRGRNVLAGGRVKSIGSPIRFETGSAKLTTIGLSRVREAAQILRYEYPGSPVVLVSSADPRGSVQMNSKLSETRGKAVESVLLRESIVVDRVIATGENLAPDDTPASSLGRFREVRIFVKVEVVERNDRRPIRRDM